MAKNINKANSKLNASNNKLKHAYSKSHSKNMKVIYMPHWLDFYSSAIHSDVTSNKKRFYKSYSRGTVVYVKLGSNIGSEFSGNHFCVILDNKDNKGKETVTIVPLSSKGNKNYLKLKNSVLNLTATDLKNQIINTSSKVQTLAEKYIGTENKFTPEDKKLLSDLNQKASELETVVGIYSNHKGKDTYANISAITTISKRRISKINDSDPTGTIIILEDDMNEIENQLKIKFFSN
ncbi:type II toxin-antitoxin system PemK/MazF family toxin [Staphylococcus saprophyticus]|uniref:type II toxin-antitoxin system PemK/MazF family toxin n=1 Tax=Staphylococcus TaxID=1279 RepID=UPI001013CA13|nr:type II toxin-antitoxin system PemK/MazF family toxin [Staphylococcus saprophyticus]MDW4166518.1 type II toxin-antitoxin system PemK/MazF family toxin [Staphylococcus saprophyticus]MDW4302039.1 type II toxin-antitoxin system PemK/MazF family toxin [Staphylococcus saprophyticus]MDW4312505.1 type II toxin-antitoxin system PemK/MazF family toxin [Staphylococcus saprophyticus]MDW4371594.1 type II toxin-antitoxin system PemK/MazF family toxin [Staphylococcus saprophyticus]MDW4460292.1 type II to